MIGPNDLKYYVISDSSQKYDEINQRIIKFTKLYFFTMKNHSYQISQIENKINEYNVNGEVKIKQLLENQQNIIKELIKLINNFLLEKRNNEVVKKLEDQMKMDKFEKMEKIEKIDINENNLPLKIKNIITHNNVHSFVPSHYSLVKSGYNKNSFNVKERISINNSIENTKNPSANESIRSNYNKSTDDRISNKKILNQKKIIPLNVIAPKSGVEFNGALSFLNIKSSKQKGKKKIFRKFLNKDMNHTGNNTTKPAKKKIFKSMSTSEVTSSNKPNLINKSNLYLKINNINNKSNNHYNPHYYNMNNNYTIDEEKNDDIEKVPSIKQTINERQISISSNNANDNYGNLPHIFTKRKKRIKYRSCSGGRVLCTEREIKRSMVRVKSAKEIPLKTDFFLHTNSSFPPYTLTNYSTDKVDIPFNRRCNSTLNFFTGQYNFRIGENKSLKKFENEIFSAPYINNGKRIIPTKVTKGVLNSSYKILNKYEQKRFKNNFG